MRRLLVLVLVAVGTWPALAQSDMTRDKVYQAGDVVDYLAVDGTGADPGPPGNGVTWDFTGLPRVPADDFTVTYAAASAAPNAGQFPEANLVGIQNVGPTDAYTFYNATNSRFTLEGLDIPDVGVVTYSNKSIWVNFPFSFNETFSDDFEGSYTAVVNGLNVVTHRTGNLTTKYDGYGTLILPNGTRVTNVRRLRMDQIVRDEVTVSGISLVTEVETITYNFWAEDERNHIFHITYGTSTVTPPGMSFDSVEASYVNYNPGGGGGGGGGTNTFAPRAAHLTAQGGDFDTEVLVHNPTAASKTLTLQPYAADGSAGTPVNVDVPAGSTKRLLQQDLFPASAAGFSSSGCDECAFSTGYRATVEGASTAHVHQNERYDTHYALYPGEWSALFDGAAIVNAGDGPALIEARQVADDGSEIDKVTLEASLAAGAKSLKIFNSLFADVPNSMLEITSDQPLAVMVLRISADGRFLYQNNPLPEVPEAGAERRLAHLTGGGDFSTYIFVHNTASTPKSVVLHPYDAAGNTQATLEVDLAGGETVRLAKDEVFGASAAHMAVTGDTEALVTVGYRANVEDAGTATIHEAPPVGTSFTLYPGEWDLLFDGFALVNTGNQATGIVVTQTRDDGSQSAMEVLVESLAPNAKFLGLLEGVIPNDPNSIITVEATQPLAILALRLSKDGRYLYGNHVLPQ